MAGCLFLDSSPAGFSFENSRRNKFLCEKNGYAPPRATKTGTTIVGVVFKDGVVLGADTRATEGDIVADKNCSKIHYVTDNIYCCGAGTAADTEMTTKSISSQLGLLAEHTGRRVQVPIAATLLKRFLFRYQGHIGAALVLGGVDKKGPHLYSIHPHGSADKLPYTTMGSGSLAAMSVFESRWKENMDKAEAIRLVRDAIAAGIFNDLGSGSNVDVCVITGSDSAEYIRPFEIANVKGVRTGKYDYPVGSTAVLSRDVVKFEVEEVKVQRVDDDSSS